jgi:hypothetical protein
MSLGNKQQSIAKRAVSKKRAKKAKQSKKEAKQAREQSKQAREHSKTGSLKQSKVSKARQGLISKSHYQGGMNFVNFFVA